MIILLVLVSFSVGLIVGAHSHIHGGNNLRANGVNGTHIHISTACDDSCEFAHDGKCDDGLVDNYAESHSGAEHHDIKSADKTDADRVVKVFPCKAGTDCTDCGNHAAPIICDNACVYKRDGICDDTRGTKYCALGTDCQDCGPVGAGNFTSKESNIDDNSANNTDDYWKFHNDSFLVGGGAWRGKLSPVAESGINGNTIAFYVAIWMLLAVAVVPMIRCVHHQRSDLEANAGTGAQEVPPRTPFATDAPTTAVRTVELSGLSTTAPASRSSTAKAVLPRAAQDRRMIYV